MSPRIIIGSLLFLILCTFIVSAYPSLASVYGAGQTITFSRTPTGYNYQTGAFTLTGQLGDDAGNGAVCATYDYFIFNAQAGQVLQGGLQTGTTSKTIYYMILNSPDQLYSFMKSSCGVHTPYWPNVAPTLGSWRQDMAPASNINWSASIDGQYALVFLANGFYSGVVYFLQ